MKYTSMKNQKILMVGFGSIGPAVLPLILKHIEIEPTHIEIIANDDRNKSLAEELGVKFSHVTLTPHNYQKEISSRLKKGDVLLNLSVWVSSADLISLCQDLGVMYLDTSIEVWPGAGRARGFERRKVVLEKRHQKPHAATALLCHGANPGLISHFAKQAVLDVAQKVLAPKLFAELSETGDWGRLAQEAGIVTLHIAERDTQISSNGRRIHEYVNTWSVEGFLDEAEEHTGFSWGTHEAEIPSHLVKAKHSGKAQVIELNRSGGKVELKSWVPSAGAFHGFVIPHAEGFSLGELFFSNHTGSPYQPTVHFVYQPCNDAIISMHDAAARGWPSKKQNRLIFDDIIEGVDELGILILRKNSSEVYWLGSRLDIHEARRLAPNNNATSLQVAAGILAGLVWIIDNPEQGIIEPEQVDFKRALEIATPYLGEFKGHWGTWVNYKENEPDKALNHWRFADLAVNLG